MEKIKINAFDMEWECTPELLVMVVPDFMGNKQNNIGLQLYTDDDEGGLEPFATITKNFGEFIGQKNCAYIDTNNCPFADQLIEQGFAVDTGLTKQSGYCTYPLWKFNEDFLRSIDPKLYEMYSNEFDAYMHEEMHDDAYMKEWTEVCAAYCKRVGAELLFVNESDFGCEMPNGELRHIYADELEALLNADQTEGGDIPCQTM